MGGWFKSPHRLWFWRDGKSSPQVPHIYLERSQIGTVHAVGYARFICTVCTCRIRWSCEGLTSVHNEYTEYTLKHLLSRHMYNLSLLNLCAMLWPDVSQSSPNYELNSHTAWCGVFYSYLCRHWQNGILGPPFAGESFDTCSKAVMLI